MLAQCYKVLINDTCTFEDVWYGRNAKIFEGCELSQSGSKKKELEFYTWELVPKQEDKVWAGTAEPYSDTYCLPFPLIGTTTAGATRESNISLWAKQAFLAAGTWFDAAYGKNNKFGGEKTWKTTPKLPHYKLPW